MKQRAYAILVAAAVAPWLAALPCRAAYPSWWASRSVTTNSSSSNNYAAANLGQLKCFATNACDELEEHLCEGAGTSVWALVRSFSASSNHVAINVGQLKYVVQPFYDRLIDEHYTNGYPWTAATNDDIDYSLVNLGQIKHVFDFDLTTDGDSDALPDWWEMHWWGNTNSNCGTNNPDGDSWTNYAEYVYGLCPTNYESDTGDEDNDGYLNIYEIEHGTDCGWAGDYPSPTIVVTNGGSNTIQACINLCTNDYDIVLVKSGTYTGVGNRDLDYNGKKILVISESGPEDCVVNCQSNGRGFYFHSAETSNSIVSGLTVMNGQADIGGGVRCSGNARPFICDSAFYLNNASSIEYGGGGIGCLQGSVMLSRSIVSSNHAVFCGGGVMVWDTAYPFTLENSLLARNTGDYGGGILTYYADGTLRNCTVVDNTCVEDGGGALFGAGTLLGQNSIVWGNSPNQVVLYEGACTMEYSDVQDGYSGTGNITNNPLFAANYSLASNSPCIDAGTNNTVLRDWQNEARWDDPAHTNTVSIWDIGFDEYPDNDNDGLPDAVETGTGIYLGPTDTGTDPDDADTDGDGINDGAEVDARTDPNNPDVVCPTVLITYPASGSVMMVYP